MANINPDDFTQRNAEQFLALTEHDWHTPELFRLAYEIAGRAPFVSNYTELRALAEQIFEDMVVHQRARRDYLHTMLVHSSDVERLTSVPLEPTPMQRCNTCGLPYRHLIHHDAQRTDRHTFA